MKMRRWLIEIGSAEYLFRDLNFPVEWLVRLGRMSSRFVDLEVVVTDWGEFRQSEERRSGNQRFGGTSSGRTVD